MKKFWKEWGYFSLFIAAVLICALVAVVHLERRSVIQNQRMWAYIAEHQCVRQGFAGKQPQAIYRCDNGLWLSGEIWNFANLNRGEE